MSRPRGMTTAESIVWLFEERVTEAHRDTIEATLRLTAEQFDQSIARARDLGIERGIYLTPLYERDGWWTADPTERIAAIAVYEAVKRNLGEAERNARVYNQFKKVGPGTGFIVAALTGGRSALENDLPELGYSPKSDYVIERVDAAEHPYVMRGPEERAAA